MKNYIVAFLTLVLLVSCADTQQNQIEQMLLSKLENYYEAKDYFNLKRVFEKNQSEIDEAHSNYYQAVITTAFNNPAKSLESVKNIHVLKNH